MPYVDQMTLIEMLDNNINKDEKQGGHTKNNKKVDKHGGNPKNNYKKDRFSEKDKKGQSNIWELPELNLDNLFKMLNHDLLEFDAKHYL